MSDQHRRTQHRSNWSKTDDQGKKLNKTREYVWSLGLGELADGTVANGCEYMSRQMADVRENRGAGKKKLDESGVRPSNWHQIYETTHHSKPLPKAEEGNVKLTETRKRIHPDGTVGEVTKTYEGPTADGLDLGDPEMPRGEMRTRAAIGPS